jgi:CheY-like chemotaxis protein
MTDHPLDVRLGKRGGLARLTGPSTLDPRAQIGTLMAKARPVQTEVGGVNATWRPRISDRERVSQRIRRTLACEDGNRSRLVSESAARVLVVDDDADIADLVEDLLAEEGYAVTLLRDRDLESVRSAVERLRPDCVLLDGAIPGVFGESWADAAWMAAMSAPVPVIMFSAEHRATREAQGDESQRSHAAHFSSVLPKPFDLDELLRVVALAVSQSPFRLGM